MSFCCHQFTSINLYTFPKTSEPAVRQPTMAQFFSLSFAKSQSFESVLVCFTGVYLAINIICFVSKYKLFIGWLVLKGAN